MKLFILLSALVALTVALKKDSEFMSQFPEAWYEEASLAAQGDTDSVDLPSFLNTEADLASDFGASQYGEPKNVLQVALKLGATLFVKAAVLTHVADTFANTQNITVFVPSNAAFLRLPPSYILYFLRHPERFGQLLKYHAAVGAFEIDQLVSDAPLHTLLHNWTLRYDEYEHAQDNRTTRVIQGSQINHRKVNRAASNGVVHLIDEVITALPVLSAYDIVSRSPHFSTLYNGLIVAGLDQVLKSNNASLTLFAPTEQAFKRLPDGVWAALLRDKAKLTAVLDYHLAPRVYFARGFQDQDHIDTLNRNNGLTIHVRGPGGEEKPERGPGVEVDVNDAKIIYFDGAVRQGVIQVIDNVLLPQSIKDEFNL